MTRTFAALAAGLILLATLLTSPSPAPETRPVPLPLSTMKDQAIILTETTSDHYSWRYVNAACNSLDGLDASPYETSVWLQRQYGVHWRDAEWLTLVALTNGCADRP